MLITRGGHEIDDDPGRLDVVQATLDHPGLQGLGRIALVTTDAHRIYADCGFVPLPDPQRWMAITTPAAERYRASCRT